MRSSRLASTLALATLLLPAGEAPGAAAAFAYVVPIVLATTGLGGSSFTTELTLTNKGGTELELELAYTAALGSGSGTVADRMAASSQRTIPDAIAYLRTLGLAIPQGENAAGTLRVTVRGLASPGDAAVLARTTTPVPDGRAGLAYPALSAGLSSSGAIICGLRQSASDRSNLALLNTAPPGSGNILLMVTVHPEQASQGAAKTLPTITLAPGGWKQLTGVLDGTGFDAGWAEVNIAGGVAPYWAYGVVNDQGSSDGSYIPAVLRTETLRSQVQILPAVVESGPFTTEVVLVNAGYVPKNLTLTFVADGITAAGGAVSTTLSLAASQQVRIDSVVDWLRKRTTGLPPAGGSLAGALFIAGVTPTEAPINVVVAGRTSCPGAVGRYGLFYPAVGDSFAFTDAAFIHGLRQDAENRTNLALVNTGTNAAKEGASFALDVFDGRTGALAGTLADVAVGPRQWVQLPTVLDLLPVPVPDAWVKVRKTAGSNPFLAYAVVNDGSRPGERSGDGAYLAAERDCQAPPGTDPSAVGRSGGLVIAIVHLPFGCAWSATTEDAWITISQPATGNGIGFVTFTVAKNAGVSVRTGTIRAGADTMTVIQTGDTAGPYDGVWSGTTDEGRPFGFTVERNEVVSLTLGMDVVIGSCSARGTYTQALAPPPGVYQDAFGGTFLLSSGGSGRPNTRLAGTFGSVTRATGSFSVPSIQTGTLDCTATGSVPGGTWTALKP